MFENRSDRRLRIKRLKSKKYRNGNGAFGSAWMCNGKLCGKYNGKGKGTRHNK